MINRNLLSIITKPNQTKPNQTKPNHTKPKLLLVAECCPSLLLPVEMFLCCRKCQVEVGCFLITEGYKYPMNCPWGTLLTPQQLAWYSIFFWALCRMHWGVEMWKLCNNPVSWICSSITSLWIYRGKQCLMFWSKYKVFSSPSSFVCGDRNWFPIPVLLGHPEIKFPSDSLGHPPHLCSI